MTGRFKLARWSVSLSGIVLLMWLLFGFQSWGQHGQSDEVEFLDGRLLKGQILEIRKESRDFDFVAAQSKTSRTYPYAQVHAVTFKGRRFILTPKSDRQSIRTDATSGIRRTTAEVLKLIDDAGRTPPDWFESTPLDHPATLELDWPLKAEGPWDEAVNVGQYIWGRVNPNVARWHSGIKLVHECMSLHQNDPQLLQRDMDKVGIMYFELLQDYPRAAFWLQKSKAATSQLSGIALAECYWQLGNKEMALEYLHGKPLNVRAIKLLAEMGELDRALALTASFLRSNQLASEALLAAGDATRNAGQLEKAVDYYQQVLKTPSRNQEYEQRYHDRARGAIEAIELFDRADVKRVAAGVYVDQSMGYNGPVEVRVAVKDSRIEEVTITNHNEKQFYAALTDTPRKIVQQQSIRNIDGTSGATITSQAIIHATARALAQGAE